MTQEPVFTEFDILKDYGLSKNEIYTYMTVLSMDSCEAKEICSRTHIPSSKIYNILERLERFGLIEIQQSRPKKYKYVALDHALENLKELKRKEYESFREKLPKLKSYLQKKVNINEVNLMFWNVTIGESEIFNRHISRFQFVQFDAMIGIDSAILDKMTKNSKMASEISWDFKEKKITTKLIIAYNTDAQKARIQNWISQRPRKIDAKNQIRLLNEKIIVPFALFDSNKVILLMRNPVKEEEFLLSIYMINKPLYEDLSTYFETLWNRAETDLTE